MKKGKKLSNQINKDFNNLPEFEWAVLAKASNILAKILGREHPIADQLTVIVFMGISSGRSWNTDLLSYFKKKENPI